MFKVRGTNHYGIDGARKLFWEAEVRLYASLYNCGKSAPVQTNVQGCGLYFLMTNSYVTKEIH